MLMLVLFIILVTRVPLINSATCACCFPIQPNDCQTPAIDLPFCSDCTSFFCANHVKGCQGSPPCKAECKSGTSTTTIPTTTSSTIKPLLTTTVNVGSFVPIGLWIISANLSLLIFVQLNFVFLK